MQFDTERRNLESCPLAEDFLQVTCSLSLLTSVGGYYHFMVLNTGLNLVPRKVCVFVMLKFEVAELDGGPSKIS
jgi:hypothetical protein